MRSAVTVMAVLRWHLGTTLGIPRLLRPIGLGQVVTRGTPPRKEGCRPASRGYALALVTCLRIDQPRSSVNSRNTLSCWADPSSTTSRASPHPDEACLRVALRLGLRSNRDLDRDRRARHGV